MRRTALITALLAALAVASAAEPVRLIFDTDMGNDIDDALALAVIHALESRAEVKLLAVTSTKDHPFSAAFVDALNHFYGRPDIPLGAVRDGSTPELGKYLASVVDPRDAFPRRLRSGAEAQEAHLLLRDVLQQQPDGSTVIVQVGFSTNLARLLALPDGHDLVKRKVRLLSLMGGAFPALRAEYNIKIDLAASQRLFREWPTEIVVSGFEIGDAIRYPAVSIERDFAYVERHPVAEAYRAYMEMPYDRQTWDLTAALYAIRPDRGYFGLSPRGRITVNDEGLTWFTPDKAGPHRYLTATASQRARVLETLVALASQPPEALSK
jgi:inosine-uridine nucleoside N-ribohydrolase